MRSWGRDVKVLISKLSNILWVNLTTLPKTLNVVLSMSDVSVVGIGTVEALINAFGRSSITRGRASYFRFWTANDIIYSLLFDFYLPRWKPRFGRIQPALNISIRLLWLAQRTPCPLPAWPFARIAGIDHILVAASSSDSLSALLFRASSGSVPVRKSSHELARDPSKTCWDILDVCGHCAARRSPIGLAFQSTLHKPSTAWSI